MSYKTFIIGDLNSKHTEALEPLWRELINKDCYFHYWGNKAATCEFFKHQRNTCNTQILPRFFISLLVSKIGFLLLPIAAALIVIKLNTIKNLDQVITLSPFDAKIFALANKFIKFKHTVFVLPEHQDIYFNSKSLKKKLKKATIITSSSIVLNRLEQAGYKNRKIIILPFLDKPKEITQANIFSQIAKHDHPKRKFFTIGTITDLTPESHIETLLKATKEVIDVVPNLQVIIVGEGPEKKNLQWMAKKMGVDSAVWFVGQSDRAIKWLDNLDLYVVTKPRLTLPNQTFIIDIMRRQLPIIADIGSGLDDVVFEGKTGQLVIFKNTNDLAQTIINLEQDASLRERMGTAAADRASKHFTVEKALDQFAKVL